MKIVLVILCAFLLKADADAQTWWNISPKNMEIIKKMQSFKTSDGKYQILVNSDTLLHILYDGTSWYNEQSYSEYCDPPDFPGYNNRFYFGNIFPAGNHELYRTYYGSACDGIDGGKAFVNSPNPDFTVDCYNDDKLLGARSISTQSNFIFAKYWGDTYITRLSDSGFTLTPSKRLNIIDNENRELTNPEISEFFSIDSRTPTFFTSVYKLTTEKSGDTLKYFRAEFLYKNKGLDSIWEAIGVVELKYELYKGYQGGIYQLEFPSSDTNQYYLATSQGLWRYNDSTNKIDTLLKIPTRSIFFKEDSDIAYAGTATGEIYRSTDSGEIWSLFASGFSTKPVIGIYASGNDSLIVGTEDGIWTNYQLPVSIAEEIPVKNDELTITPNPANSSLKISFLKTESPQQLSIYNSLGQLLFKTEFSGEFVWDFNNDIVDGVYTVAVQSGGKSVAKQVVILR